MVPEYTPAPGQGRVLGQNGSFTSVRVQFAASVTYDQALASLMALGFRLSNPCLGAQAPSAVNPVGQETAFASSHALRVTTSFANSTLWRQQLTQTAGVLSTQERATAGCA